MGLLHYVEIEKFKTFDEKIRIELAHPAVLIGPNNSGKTSVIQAIALWSRGVKAWYMRRESRRKDKLELLSADINRKDILEVPVQEAGLLWSNSITSISDTPIPIIINVGIEVEGKVYDCGFSYTYGGNEVVFCNPLPNLLETELHITVIKEAAEMGVNLLYPMSGIVTEEPLLQEGRINVLIGQGQTAQVLRNLCYNVFENSTQNWREIVSLMSRLFAIELGKPIFRTALGTVELGFWQHSSERMLDISVAGSGMQQVLLILAYLFGHQKSILMIDEPDAHLEILRQRQIFEVLKHVCSQQMSQAIIATHAEVIVEDAMESNLTLLLNGKAQNLALQDDIKKSLRDISAETYYKAQVLPRILYLEGSTDLVMLKALAMKLNHPASAVLGDRLNCYYSRNIHFEDTLDSRLENLGKSFERIEAHFYPIRHLIPELRGVGIFDGDARGRQDEIKPELAILYWQLYELENYFITPAVLIAYIERRYRDELPIFAVKMKNSMRECVEAVLTETVFKGSRSKLAEFLNLSNEFQLRMLQNVKMSDFAEQAFERFAQVTGQSVLLRKGQYYELVEDVLPENIPDEVTEKLDVIADYLAVPTGGN